MNAWTFATAVTLEVVAIGSIFLYRRMAWKKFGSDMERLAKDIVVNIMEQEIESRLKYFNVISTRSLSEPNKIVLRWEKRGISD